MYGFSKLDFLTIWSGYLADGLDAALPSIEKIMLPSLGLKNLAPYSAHGRQIIGGWHLEFLAFDQQPGNGRGVTQIDRQLHVWCFKEGVLAGEATYTAGKLRVEGQMLVPEYLVALFTDAIQAVTLRGVQRTAQCRLTGRSSQQQRFGRGAMAFEIEKGRADHMLAEIAGGNSHGILAEGAGGGRALGSCLQTDEKLSALAILR